MKYINKEAIVEAIKNGEINNIEYQKELTALKKEEFNLKVYISDLKYNYFKKLQNILNIEQDIFRKTSYASRSIHF